MRDYEGIIALLLLAAVALIGFGDSRLAAIRKGSNDKRKKWLPHLALAVGYSCLSISALVLVFILHDLYRLAQLDSAIGTVRELVAAETVFSKSHPKQGYTCSLAELATDDRISGETKMFIKTGQRNGYSFEIRGCQKVDGKPNPAYEIIARPLHDSDPHGGDNVCAEQSGIVHFSKPGCDYE